MEHVQTLLVYWADALAEVAVSEVVIILKVVSFEEEVDPIHANTVMLESIEDECLAKVCLSYSTIRPAT